ncbi:putative O-methyltransferase domain, S-adenosyl-L-methionine-dependent methyltransferase [Helianthus debilis subsp. tardiflorus]
MITNQELISQLNLPIDKTFHLQRLMRLLSYSNFFSVTKLPDQDDEGYVLTAASKLLLNNTGENQQNLLPFASLVLDPVLMTPWQFLGKSFNGNKSTVFETAHGIPFWEFANKNPRFNRLFNDVMASDSQMMSLVVKDCGEIFEGVESLDDVGGGAGLMDKILLEAFPRMTCTVLDLPHVVAGLTETRNLKYVGGDMFSFIPSADAIFFKVLNILKLCREAIRFAGDKGKVIIIDIVVDAKHERHEITETKMVFDVVMMVLFAGRERTKVECEKLFLEAGFTRYKITPNFGLRSLIEVFP